MNRAVTSRGGSSGTEAPATDELVPNPQQHSLAVDLPIDVVLDLSELLDPFDLDPSTSFGGDIEVFPYRADPPADPPGRAQERTDLGGDLTGLGPARDVRSRCDFDERDPEPIEPVRDPVGRFPHPAGGVLLETDRVDAVSTSVHLDVAPRGHQRRSLETGSRRAVDHDLPHDLDLIDGTRSHHEGEQERRLQGGRVERVRRLLVHLDVTAWWDDLVSILEAARGLEGGCGVNGTILAAGRPERADERPRDFLGKFGRTRTEQLAGRELLVHFEAGLHVGGPPV